MTKVEMAIRAAANETFWGHWATLLYVQKNGIGALYRMARQLQAVEGKIGVKK